MPRATERPILIGWLGRHNSIASCLPTDLKTIPKFAYERVRDGAPLPGVWGRAGLAADGIGD
jgi:hypothetical protein